MDVTPVMRAISLGMGNPVRVSTGYDPIYAVSPVRFTVHHNRAVQKALYVTPEDLRRVAPYDRTVGDVARVKTGTVPGGHSAGTNPAQAEALHMALLKALGHDPKTGRLAALADLPGLENHRVVSPIVHGGWAEHGQIYQDPHLPIVVPRSDAPAAADILGGAFRQAAIGVEYPTHEHPNTLIVSAHHRMPITPSEARRIGETAINSGTGFAPDITPGQSVSHHFLYPGSSPFAEESSADSLSPEAVQDIAARASKLATLLRGNHDVNDIQLYGAKTGLLAAGAADKPVHPRAQEIADIYSSIYGGR